MTTEDASGIPQNGISADEVALYDRQIRLWGMEAQTRMRNAHVLLITMKALANEVAKNLILAGIGRLTILDHCNVTEDDLGAQFLVFQESVGKNRAVAAAENARKLNPRVEVLTDEEDIRLKPAEYFTQFDVVVACNLDLAELIRINTACRLEKKPFYAAEIPGLTGFVFADLVEHSFVTEREELSTTGERQRISIPAKESYISLEESLTHNYGATLRPKNRKKVSAVLPFSVALLQYKAKYKSYPVEGDSKFLEMVGTCVRDFGLPQELGDPTTLENYLPGCSAELSAVAAIVGGVLSQDVLNVLSRREYPIQNFFIFDGDSGEGPIYKL